VLACSFLPHNWLGWLFCCFYYFGTTRGINQCWAVLGLFRITSGSGFASTIKDVFKSGEIIRFLITLGRIRIHITRDRLWF